MEGETQWFRRLGKRTPTQDPAGGKIVRIPLPPLRLHLAAARAATFRLATSTLPRPDSRIGTEPAMADTTGSLPSVSHGDSSSPRSSSTISVFLDYRTGGSFLESIGRSLLASAEGPWERSIPREIMALYIERNPPMLQVDATGAPCLVTLPRIWQQRD